MKILHTLFTNDVGGTERYVADLANSQVADGHEVSVMIRGNRCTRYEVDAFLGWLDDLVNVISLPGNWIFTRWPLLPIWKNLHKFKPDIIHTHHGRDSRYLAKLSGETIVVSTLHMAYRDKDYHKHNGLICVSDWQFKTIPEHMRDDTVVIPNWVKPFARSSAVNKNKMRKQIGISNDTLLFGAVGRLSHEKGHADLVTAFLRADIPNSHLVIFGDGELYDLLIEQIGEHKDKISLMGAEKNIRPWYDVFDIFVSPSHKESFGLVLLEAMDAGCPIITTRTDGANDMLRQNENVAMVGISNHAALANALKVVAEKPVEKIEYSELEIYRLEQSAQSTMNFYNRLLS